MWPGHITQYVYFNNWLFGNNTANNCNDTVLFYLHSNDVSAFEDINVGFYNIEVSENTGRLFLSILNTDDTPDYSGISSEWTIDPNSETYNEGLFEFKNVLVYQNTIGEQTMHNYVCEFEYNQIK